MAPLQAREPVDYKLATFLEGSLTLNDYVWAEEEWPRVAYNEYSKEANVPIVDMNSLRSEDEAVRKSALQELKEAGKEWGFFRLINHGIPAELMRRMEAHGEQLFSLPLAEKRKALRMPDSIIGYYVGSESVFSKGKSWLEAFHFSGDEDVTNNMLKQVAPEKFEELSGAVLEYIRAYEKLAVEVVEMMAVALGVHPSSFSKFAARKGDKSTVRICYYPPCPQPTRTLGQRPHADPNLATIVYQDEVGGLQVLKNGKWVAVKPEPGSVVVNVGDTLQVLSNDVYPSVQHRVVLNAEKARMSMAFFLIPEAEASIEACAELVSAERPCVHPAYVYRDYRKSYGERRVVGKSHLDAFYTLQQQPDGLANNNS